jgi:hypothetical protein
LTRSKRGGTSIPLKTVVLKLAVNTTFTCAGRTCSADSRSVCTPVNRNSFAGREVTPDENIE